MAPRRRLSFEITPPRRPIRFRRRRCRQPSFTPAAAFLFAAAKKREIYFEYTRHLMLCARRFTFIPAARAPYAAPRRPHFPARRDISMLMMRLASRHEPAPLRRRCRLRHEYRWFIYQSAAMTPSLFILHVIFHICCRR